MKTLKTQRREAHAAAKFRGHSMSRFKLAEGSYYDLYISTCTNCQMEMCINPDPLPNGVDVSGQALALNCKAKES